MVIDWSRAPEGATHKGSVSWFKCEGEKVFTFDGVSWQQVSWKPWQLAGFAKKTETNCNGWGDDGLPQAGTVCEVFHAGFWYETTIIGKDPDDGSVVFKTHQSFEIPYDGYLMPESFRPIHNEDQSSSERREREINEVLNESTSTFMRYCEDLRGALLRAASK